MSRHEGIRAIVDDVLARVPHRQTAVREYLRRCAAMASPPVPACPSASPPIPNIASQGGADACAATAKDAGFPGGMGGLPSAGAMQPNTGSEAPSAASASVNTPETLEEGVLDGSPLAQAGECKESAGPTVDSGSFVSPHEIAARLWLTLFRPDLVRELGPPSPGAWSFRLDDAMLATLLRMLTHGFLVPGEQVRVDHTAPTDGSGSAVVSSVTLCMMDETVRKLAAPEALGPTPAPAAELRLVQFMLTACTLPGQGAALDGENLRSALGQLARVFVRSRHVVNQNAARAAITQIVTERMDASMQTPEHLASFALSPASSLRSLPSASSTPLSAQRSVAMRSGHGASWPRSPQVIFSWMCSVLRGSLAQRPSPPHTLIALLADLLLSAVRNHAQVLPVACVTDDLLPLVLAAWPTTAASAVPGMDDFVLDSLSAVVSEPLVLARCKAAAEVMLVHVLGLCAPKSPSAKQPQSDPKTLSADAARRLKTVRWVHRALLADPQLVAALFANFDCDASMAPVLELLVRRLLFVTHTASTDALAAACLDGLLAFASACDAWALSTGSATASASNETLAASSGDSSPASAFSSATCLSASKALYTDHINPLEDPRGAIAAAERQRAKVHRAIAAFATQSSDRIAVAVAEDILPPLSDHGHEDAPRHPVRIAAWLRLTRGLSKAAIGTYLSAPANAAVLGAFVASFDVAPLSFVAALRMYLESFKLPGEAQQIERFMEQFSARFVSEARKSREIAMLRSLARVLLASPTGSGAMQSSESAEAVASAPSEEDVEQKVRDMVFQLAFSTVMLNTDVHSVQVRIKMDADGFARNTIGAFTSLSEDALSARPGGREARAAVRAVLDAVFDEIAEREIVLDTPVIEHPIPLSSRLGAPWVDVDATLCGGRLLPPLVEHTAVHWAHSVVAALGRLLPVSRPGASQGVVAPGQASRPPPLLGESSDQECSRPATVAGATVSEIVSAVCVSAEQMLRVGLSPARSRKSSDDAMSTPIGNAVNALLTGLVQHADVLRGGPRSVSAWVYEGLGKRLGSLLCPCSWRAVLRATCRWERSACVDDARAPRVFDIIALDGRGTLALLSALVHLCDDAEGDQTVGAAPPMLPGAVPATVSLYAGLLAQLPPAHIERLVRNDSLRVFRLLARFASSPTAPERARSAAWELLSRVAREQMPLLLAARLDAVEAFITGLVAFARDEARAEAVCATLGHVGELMFGQHVGGRTGPSAPPSPNAECGEAAMTPDDAPFLVRWHAVLVALCSLPPTEAVRETLAALLAMPARNGASFTETAWHFLWTLACAPVLANLASSAGVAMGAVCTAQGVPSSKCSSGRASQAATDESLSEIGVSGDLRAEISVQKVGTGSRPTTSLMCTPGDDRSPEALQPMTAEDLEARGKLYTTALQACVVLVGSYPVPMVSISLSGVLRHIEAACCAIGVAGVAEAGHRMLGELGSALVDSDAQLSVVQPCHWKAFTDAAEHAADACTVSTGEMDALADELSSLAIDPSTRGSPSLPPARLTVALPTLQRLDVVARQCSVQLVFLAALRTLCEPPGEKPLSPVGEDQASTSTLGDQHPPLLRAPSLSPADILRLLAVLRRSYDMAVVFNANVPLRMALVARGFAPSFEMLVLLRQETAALSLMLHLSTSSVGRYASSASEIECFVETTTRDILAAYVRVRETGATGTERSPPNMSGASNPRRPSRSWTDLARRVFAHWRADLALKSCEEHAPGVADGADTMCARVAAAIDVCAVCERNTLLAADARAFILACVSRPL